jgi:S1-C subfamily serine protease
VKPETRINVFIAASLLLFGAFIGTFTTYQHFDNRISSLEEQIQSQKTVTINSSFDNSLSNVFQQSDQSVVSIRTSGSSAAEGSGFVYTERGHIVTNYHVIEDADQVSVSFTDGTSRNAEIIGADEYTDLAVLKVNKRNLESLDLANSEEVQVGERVAAIGNPFGLSGSMTSGIISQKERRIRVGGGFSIPNVLQTDAAINPGNSGGPLINMKGNVVGVNTAIQTNTGTFSGIGFAVSSRTVEEVVPEIIETNDYEHSWLGVTGLNVNSEIAGAMNLENASGFLIQSVIEDGPAAEAGIRGGTTEMESNSNVLLGGDVIVGIGDRKVDDINDILDYLLRKTEVGDQITLHIIRDGERKSVELTLQDRPQEIG